MSGLHYGITGSIGCTLPIYPDNLSLLAFTPKEPTVTFFKFAPRCHVTRIPRSRYVRAALHYQRQHWVHLFFFTDSSSTEIFSLYVPEVLLLKFDPRCHVTRITRNRYVRAALHYHRQHWVHLAYLSC